MTILSLRGGSFMRVRHGLSSKGPAKVRFAFLTGKHKTSKMKNVFFIFPPVGANCVRPPVKNDACGRTQFAPTEFIHIVKQGCGSKRSFLSTPFLVSGGCPAWPRLLAGAFLLRELAACELIAVCFVAFVARRASVLTNVYAVGICLWLHTRRGEPCSPVDKKQ